MKIILKYFSDFTEKQLQQFAALEELYNDWNSKINVISRKDINGLYEKHILHSLSIAAVTDFKPGTNIIDIGTGGGFPGIPLAIFFPEAEFHLVDSIAKKLKVVTEISSAIDLKNITTQHIRAEEIKNRKFDFAVSRAVAPLKELWRWSKPLLKKGVRSHETADRKEKSQTRNYKPETANSKLQNGLICLKGGDLAQEIFESGLRPNVVLLSELFKEDFFAEKYLLHVNV